MGESAGTATITYSTATGCYVTAAVSVLAAPEPFFGPFEVCTGVTSSFFDGTPGGTWSSHNTAVITIGATTGFATGVSIGFAEIVYTLSSGCADSQMIAVSAPPVAGTIAGPASECVGSTVHLTDGSVGGFWSSSSGGFVAQVGFSGQVTGMSAGSDVISYTVSNSCSSAVATYPFTVDGFPNAGTITGPDTVCLGGYMRLADAAGGGTWSSGSGTIATVTSSGTVYGALNGSVSVIYTVTNSCGSTIAEFPVMVVSNGACATEVNNAANSRAGQMIVFPNPNEGTFSINIVSDINEQAQVVISNVVGEKVMEFTMAVNKVVPVNIPKQGSGIFILSATTNSGKYVAKIMVE